MYYLRSLMLELKRLKEIQHDNVTRFVGACLDPGTQNTEWLFVPLYDITLLKDLLSLISGFLSSRRFSSWRLKKQGQI